jgi:hypothetical protein
LSASELTGGGLEFRGDGGLTVSGGVLLNQSSIVRVTLCDRPGGVRTVDGCSSLGNTETMTELPAVWSQFLNTITAKI